MKFIGREKELKTIRNAINDEKTKAVLVYGRRRMGKTTLIKEALKGVDGVSVIYRCKEQSVSRSIEEISVMVTKALNLSSIAFPTFEALFAFLSTRKERVVIVLDEYQDMRKLEGDYVDALLRNAMDDMAENIKIIISGSAIRIMKKLLNSDNPLYGRFKAEVFVAEMDYYDASLFYSGYSSRDKIILYSVFGGIPWIIESIDSTKSVEENIRDLLLEKKGLARGYVEDVIDVECSEINYSSEVFRSIKNSKKRFSDISSYLNIESAKTQLTRTLKNMAEVELITKRFPINTNSPKSVFYEISSNIVRFYFAYQDVLLDENIASVDNLYKIGIEPSLNTFVSYRFEEMCRSYFKRLSESAIRDDIVRIGSYWYDDPKRRKNGEFDVAIEKVNGSFEIYECKFFKDKASRDVVLREKEKVDEAPLRGVSRFGFISSSSFDFSSLDDIILISGDDLYSL